MDKIHVACETIWDTITFVGILRRGIESLGFLGGAGFCPSTVWGKQFNRVSVKLVEVQGV